MSARVFGPLDYSAFKEADFLGDIVSAARTCRIAQVLVRVTEARNISKEDQVLDLLLRLQRDGEQFTMQIEDPVPSECKDTRVMIVVFACVTLPSSRREVASDSILEYVAKLVAKLPNATRADAHALIDRVAVLMSLMKYRGNRTAVAKELRMQRALVTTIIQAILDESGMDPSLLPARRRYFPKSKKKPRR